MNNVNYKFLEHMLRFSTTTQFTVRTVKTAVFTLKELEPNL